MARKTKEKGKGIKTNIVTRGGEAETDKSVV